MSKHSLYKIAAIMLFAVIVAAVPQFAHAANTPAGTTITNTATVNFTVGAVPQTAVANTTTFVVDRVIYLTVTKQADVTSAPSSTNQAIQFLVTNNTNTTMRFALTPVSKGTNTWTLITPAIYLDNNNNGIHDAGDTLYTDASSFGNILSGQTFTVLIVGDIPAGVTNGMIADYDLLATAVDAGTLTVSTETAGTKTAGNLSVVMTIFGDGAGSAAGDVARDGRHSASGRFTITAAGLAVAKLATVYSDPVSGTTATASPRAIPGAVIIYTITITNAAGGAAASNVHITDALPANTSIKATYDDGVVIGCANGGAVSVNGGAYACAGSNVWVAGQIDVTTASVPAGQTWALKYQVTVQ
jgi:uncharacterized repeat protein (TIGR01451 family)